MPPTHPPFYYMSGTGRVWLPGPQYSATHHLHICYTHHSCVRIFITFTPIQPSRLLESCKPIPWFMKPLLTPPICDNSSFHEQMGWLQFPQTARPAQGRYSSRSISGLTELSGVSGLALPSAPVRMTPPFGATLWNRTVPSWNDPMH